MEFLSRTFLVIGGQYLIEYIDYFDSLRKESLRKRSKKL